MAKSKIKKFAKKNTATVIAVGGLALVLGLAIYAFSDRQRLYSKLEEKVLGGGSSDSDSSTPDVENFEDESLVNGGGSLNNPENNNTSILGKIQSIPSSVFSAKALDRPKQTLDNLTRNQIVNLRSYLSQSPSRQTNTQLNNAVREAQQSRGFQLAQSTTNTDTPQAIATYLTSRSSFDRNANINNTSVGHSGFRSVTKISSRKPSSSRSASHSGFGTSNSSSSSKPTSSKVSKFLTQNRNKNRRF